VIRRLRERHRWMVPLLATIVLLVLCWAVLGGAAGALP